MCSKSPLLLQEAPLNDLEVKNLVCSECMKHHTVIILFKETTNSTTMMS
jgi:hypothetical protein